MPSRTAGPTRVAIVHLDRSAAMGSGPRLRAWEAISRASGATEVALIGVKQLRLPVPDPRTLWHLARADAVVESTVRSVSSLRSRVADFAPDTVVFVTARVFDPVVARGADHAVLDLVDELSENYRLRASRDSTAGRRIAFRCLEAPMRRFERKPRDIVTTAAGRSDAARLKAQWVPNLLGGDAPPHQAVPDAHDLLFVGSLNYEPNMEALRWFSAVWQRLRAVRPEATMLIAGANPAPGFLRWLQSVQGWTVQPDFVSLDDVFARGRIAVAPIQSATGFQNKVLEAAERAVPQVVSVRVTAGLGSDYPGPVAQSSEEWLDVLCELLDLPEKAAQIAATVREHALDCYRPGAYTHVLQPSAVHLS